MAKNKLVPTDYMITEKTLFVVNGDEFKTHEEAAIRCLELNAIAAVIAAADWEQKSEIDDNHVQIVLDILVRSTNAMGRFTAFRNLKLGIENDQGQ